MQQNEKEHRQNSIYFKRFCFTFSILGVITVTAKAAGTATITVKCGTAEDVVIEATVDEAATESIVSYDFESDNGSITGVGKYGTVPALEVVDTSKLASGALKVTGNWNAVATFTGTLPEGKTLADYTGLKFNYYGITDESVEQGDTYYKNAYVYAAAADATMQYIEDSYLATVQTTSKDAWGTSSFTFDADKLAAITGIEAGRTVQLGIGINCAAVYFLDDVYLVDAEGNEYLIQNFDDAAPTVNSFGQWGAPTVELVDAATVLSATLNAETLAKLGNKMLQVANTNYNEGFALKFVLPEGKSIADYTGLSFDVRLFTTAGNDHHYKDFFAEAGTTVESITVSVTDYVAWATEGNQGAWVTVSANSWDTIKTTVGDATEFYVAIGLNSNGTTPYFIDNVILVEAE